MDSYQKRLTEVEQYQLLTEIIIKGHWFLIFITDSSTITLVSSNLLFISFHYNATGYFTGGGGVQSNRDLS